MLSTQDWGAIFNCLVRRSLVEEGHLRGWRLPRHCHISAMSATPTFSPVFAAKTSRLAAFTRTLRIPNAALAPLSAC